MYIYIYQCRACPLGGWGPKPRLLGHPGTQIQEPTAALPFPPGGGVGSQD